jgi:hypothetical protein
MLRLIEHRNDESPPLPTGAHSTCHNKPPDDSSVKGKEVEDTAPRQPNVAESKRRCLTVMGDKVFYLRINARKFI